MSEPTYRFPDESELPKVEFSESSPHDRYPDFVRRYYDPKYWETLTSITDCVFENINTEYMEKLQTGSFCDILHQIFSLLGYKKQNNEPE